MRQLFHADDKFVVYIRSGTWLTFQPDAMHELGLTEQRLFGIPTPLSVVETMMPLVQVAQRHKVGVDISSFTVAAAFEGIGRPLGLWGRDGDGHEDPAIAQSVIERLWSAEPFSLVAELTGDVEQSVPREPTGRSGDPDSGTDADCDSHTGYPRMESILVDGETLGSDLRDHDWPARQGPLRRCARLEPRPQQGTAPGLVDS